MKALARIMVWSTKRLLILNLLFAAILVTFAWGSSPSDPLIQELAKSAGNNIEVSYHPGTGKVSSLRTSSASAIPQPSAIARDATPETAARSFLGRYGVLFGITDPSQELTVKRETTADRGRSFVRFQQVYTGIPVIGGELIVQMDSAKNVLSVNGKISPNPSINPIPTFPPEPAKEKAIAVVESTYDDIDAVNLRVSEPELWIYNPLLLGRGPNVNILVWRMEVKPTDTRPIRELVLIDASSGNVLLHFNQIDSALNRKIYDHNNTPGKALPGGPADLKRSEGQGPSGITDVDLAYDYAGDTYNFYFTYHGRDSLNNAGMQLISTTRYCPNSSNCPYQNAFWNGTQMVYGVGFASADDVVAHEMTHGVTEHESDLIYLMQSGAINESFSDIWGEFVDLTNARGNDTPSVRWLMGEDLSVGAVRNMSNPPAFGDPDRMQSPDYWTHQCDNGGVHINSGIGNKAAYLMTDGGSFNGKTVTGLGITKVAKIFYEAQTNLLTSASDYNNLADALQQACTNLVGTAGITASDCQQVANAIIATEMNQTPPANVLNNPGFEDGKTGWTEYSSGGYDIISNEPGLSVCFSNWVAVLGGYNNATEYIYQDVTIPSSATQAYLRFAYLIFTTESGTVRYDKMNVELRSPSDNALLTTLITLSNVDDTAFSYYLSTKYDLLSYQGQTIRLRFYATTDSSLPTLFFVDDIVLTAVVAAGTPETISTPNTPSGPTDGFVQTSYSYTTGGSLSNLGNPVQYFFDWGDGTNSGWLAVGVTGASKSWTNLGHYPVKVQARCATHTSVFSSLSAGLTVNITPSVTLQSPSNGAIFNACSLITKNQPTFTWTAAETFTSCMILLSTPGGVLINKATIRGTGNSWIPSSFVWKKLMTSCSQNGEVYWKVIGKRPNRTTGESEAWSFSIGPPQLVTINAPPEGPLPGATPPTFDFSTNCNVKFKLEISSVADFSDPKKIKSFNYTTRDPNTEQKLIKKLPTFQWNSVKKMVGTGTGYFRIKAWDGIKRETVSEVRWFTIQ